MIGRNTLELNRATMLEAVQLWLASQFKEPPTAESIRYSTQDGGHFEVDVMTVDSAAQKHVEGTDGIDV